MSKPRKEIRSRRTLKYAFPVVRTTLDDLGAPPQMRDLDDDQAGPALVSLAVHIAQSCARAIFEQITESRRGCGGAEDANLLIPQMFERVSLAPGTAEHLLLLRSGRWWAEFVRKAESAFGRLARTTGPIRWVLRSCVAESEINERLASELALSLDTAWVQRIQRSVSSEPAFDGARSLNEALIRKWRSNLIKEDADQSRWINLHAGPRHPCASSYWTNEPAIKDIGYSSSRARSELYFILSERETAAWSPFISSQFSAGDWAEWQNVAQTAKAPFWRKPKDKAKTR